MIYKIAVGAKYWVIESADFEAACTRFGYCIINVDVKNEVCENFRVSNMKLEWLCWCWKRWKIATNKVVQKLLKFSFYSWFRKRQCLQQPLITYFQSKISFWTRTEFYLWNLVFENPCARAKKKVVVILSFLPRIKYFFWMPTIYVHRIIIYSAFHFTSLCIKTIFI